MQRSYLSGASLERAGPHEEANLKPAETMSLSRAEVQCSNVGQRTDTVLHLQVHVPDDLRHTFSQNLFILGTYCFH